MNKLKAPFLCLALSSLLLNACGKETTASISQPGANSRLAPEVLESLKVFKNPAGNPEAQLKQAGTILLKSGYALPTVDAEACIASPAAPEAVHQLCALVWSTNPTEHSSPVEEYILKQSGASDTVAIALSLKPELLRGVGGAGLVAALDRLAKQPVWIRAKLVNDWIAATGNVPEANLPAIREAISLSPHPSPESLTQTLTALAKIDETAFTQLINGYCLKEQSAVLKTRCWRAQAALLQANASEEVSARLKAQSPPADFTSKQIFERNFRQLSLNAYKQ